MSEPVPVVEESAEALPRAEADLVARLEALRNRLTHGISILNRTWVDRDEIVAEISDLIAQLPREVRHARQLVQHGQEILDAAQSQAQQLLADASAEAEEIRRLAREEAQQLVDASSIKQTALQQAELILEQAKDHALQVQQGAYDYAEEVLTSLAGSIQNLLAALEQSRERVRAARPAPPAAEPSAGEAD